ncbi:hypothetical protein F0L68_20345 [Solihabitans fulvus]|uniref:DAGKc domain-containing protein n=1 Tax=Solihabitans fulvus TaxID=1892852 RepID=A0A5B2XAI4_9PSEU|nr:hypothetical protein [Solihabitans fulvus]KAA2260081.1 hypothetical protein F0L68_20345 [Solihabitans fulvus]
MRGIVLACGNAGGHTELPSFTERDDLRLQRVPVTPGKADLDPVLSELGDLRLVVAGTDADLAAVVLRLLRTERLGEIPIGYLPADHDSEVAKLWGLSTDPGRALDVALGGEPDPVPLVRDDVGGVLLGLGVIAPVRGVGYCDDNQVLRGQAARVEVTADPDRKLGLVVHVTRRGLIGRRTTTTQGRAFQVGCLPTTVTSDGVRHPRPMNKWTWYRHTEDLRLVRGLA